MLLDEGTAGVKLPADIVHGHLTTYPIDTAHPHYSLLTVQFLIATEKHPDPPVPR